jgi:glycerol-3-phosphate dehydrogenase (NAD(P)+)
VIGGGGWGTALSILLAEKDNVKLWVHDKKRAGDMKQTRENKEYLPEVKIPDNIDIISDISELNGDIFVLAVPTDYLRGVLEQNPQIFNNKIIVSTGKGLEGKTLMRHSQIIEDVTKNNKIVVLSGPNFSKELARKVPTSTIIASLDNSILTRIQETFNRNYFHVHTSSDLVGVEFCGALKNIIAIMAGILDGLNYGYNSMATLVTQGFSEIQKLGIALGGKQETFLDLAGLGDLVLTCIGEISRNRTIGTEISKGKTLDQILGDMKMVAEGVNTTKSAVELAKKNNINTPIINGVNDILFNGKDPEKTMKKLLLEDYSY